MASFVGTNIVEDGLILNLDAQNNKSYSGKENLVTYSTYNSLTWSNIFPLAASITPGIDDPNGSYTAVRFTCNNNTNALLRVYFPSFTPNGTDVYTLSFYVRKISGTGAAITDLRDGAPTVNYSAQLITNTWVRVVVSAAPTAAVKEFIDLFSDQTTNYVLDFWGVQLEKSATVSDYTPTNGSVILRNYWYDLSSNGNNATLINNPTYDNNGSFVFNGTTNSATVINGSIGNFGTSNFTVSCWGKATPGSTQTRGIFSKYDPHSANGTGWFMFFADGNIWGRITQDLIAPLEASSISKSIPTNAWYMFTMIRNTNKFSLFSNDTLLQENTTTNIINCSSSGALKIGSGYGSGYYYSGNCSGVSIYNRALSVAEVKQNFEALRGRFGV